jgi:hypothetical protein
MATNVSRNRLEISARSPNAQGLMRLRRSPYLFCLNDAQFGPASGAKPPNFSSRTTENCMNLIKSSAIVLALSAMLASPVLAQSAAPSTRGATQGKSSMQSGASGSGDEEMDTPAAPPAKSTKSKGTVGSAKTTPHSGAGMSPDPAPAAAR